MKILRLILVSLALVSASAFGEMLEITSRTTFKTVEVELTKLRENNALTRDTVSSVVRSYILPNMDKKFFAFKVLGKHLNKMTSEQKQEFIEVLTDRLVKNYVTTLTQFQGESLQYGEVRYSKTGKTAVANIQMTTNTNVVAMQTKWRYSKESQQWLMYDLVVEGISLLKTKQKELASLLAKSDIDSVIKRLKTT